MNIKVILIKQTLRWQCCQQITTPSYFTPPNELDVCVLTAALITTTSSSNALIGRKELSLSGLNIISIPRRTPENCQRGN